jgi:fatty acid desaturase
MVATVIHPQYKQPLERIVYNMNIHFLYHLMSDCPYCKFATLIMNV